MSISKEIHIGAYLKLETKLTAQTEISFICPNHPSYKHEKPNLFCSICGQKTIQVETKIPKYIDLYDLIKNANGVYDDVMLDVLEDFSATSIFLIGNINHKNSPDSFNIFDTMSA